MQQGGGAAPAAALPLSRPLVATRPWLMTLSLAAADVLALAASCGLALVSRASVENDVELALYATLWPILGLFVLAYGASGLYPGIGMGAVDESRRVVAATTLVFSMLASFTFLLKSGPLYSRSAFLMSWALGSVMVPVTRALARRLLARTRWWGAPVAILGGGQAARVVIEFLEQHPELGLRPVATLPGARRETRKWEKWEWDGVPAARGMRTARLLAEQFGVRYAIIAAPELPREQVLAAVEQCRQFFPRILLIPDLFGVATLSTTTRDLGGTLAIEFQENLLQPFPRFLKRALDLVGGVTLGIVTLPLIALVALLIRLDSPGPVLFRQRRVGKGGREFHVLKFRTMVVDAEARLAEVLRDPAARAEYERYHKLRNDPRVTRVGRLLRKLSLDELPQLWNVIKGEMGLVGPRTYLIEEKPLLEASGAAGTILRVPPGITGLWQVSGRNETSFEQRIRLEDYYVRNWSVWLDLYILARTVLVVLQARGAY